MTLEREMGLKKKMVAALRRRRDGEEGSAPALGRVPEGGQEEEMMVEG